MNPRIRTVLIMLAFALLAAPAQAHASWAHAFAVNSCGLSGVGPFAIPGTDAIAPSAAWQKGTPSGTVNVPLAGTGVAFEWKVDCGLTQSAASGNATITGNGSHTLTHRAQDGTAVWSDWDEHIVRIDASMPVNDTGTSSAWRRGDVTVPLDVSDDVSPVHGEWKIDNGSWTLSETATVSGTGQYTLTTAAVDAAGNRTEKPHTVRIDDTVPDDNTIPPVGWQHNTTQVTVTGDDNGQSGVAGAQYQLDGGPVTPIPNGTPVTINTHGTHTLKTKIVDVVGNESDWVTHIVQVDAAGPADTTSVPAGWVTAPSVTVNVTGTDTGGSGIVRVEWDRDNGAATGDVAGAGPVPVLITGDGDHTIRTRLTDGMGDTSGWTTRHVRIDTVTPTNTTTAPTGWLPLDDLDVTVAGTDAHSGMQRVEWRLDNVDGAADAVSATVSVSGDGEHTLESRVIDVAGNASPWVSRVIRLDSTAPDDLTPELGSTGWRTSSYSVLLNGSDGNSGVDSVRWRVDGGPEHVGTRLIETAVVTGNGPHTLETRVRDVAGNYSGWRSEPVNIDAVKPTDTTVYPVAPVPNGRKVPITATDAHSGPSGAVEWQLDAGSVNTSTSATIIGGGSHTLKTRVQDNAGNWSDWRSGTVVVNPALPMEDSDAPIDTTTIPTNWRTAGYTVTVSADDAGGSGIDYVEWRFDGNPIEAGPSGTQFTVTVDGVHEIETRATDLAGNTSAWRAQTLKVDRTLPSDTTSLPTDWTRTATVTLSATDATSGIDRIEYKLDNGVVQTVASGGSFTVTDGTHTIAHRVHDVAGQLTAWKTDTIKVDTVAPSNDSAAAPAAWQTSALSLPLVGSDTRSGVDHAEWRVDGGDVQTGDTATVETEGSQTLETRIVDKAGNASSWRSEPVRVDHTKPVNTTPLPGAAWRKTNYTTTVAGTDATPGSGVLRIEYKLDNGAVTTTPAVTISTAGSHKLESRVIDTAGNASDWRTDMIGIDKTVPTLSVDCGADTWRASAATCSVSSDGGESGLPTLTAAHGTGDPHTFSGTSYTVDADGSATITFRAVDGAGNETVKTAGVKIDRTPPAAAVSCALGAGTTYVCTGSGADDLSGLAGLSWSVDGAPATALGNQGSFTVSKGTVLVTAVDAAGNAAASVPVTLAVRTPPKPPAPVAEAPATPRTTSEAVLLRGGGSASARLVGQLALSATPTATTVDLRPLALGTGTFQIVIKVTTGKKTKTVRKTVKTHKGYSPRVKVKAAAAADVKVKLTIRRKSGKRWVTHAAGSASLG